MFNISETLAESDRRTVRQTSCISTICTMQYVAGKKILGLRKAHLLAFDWYIFIITSLPLAVAAWSIVTARGRWRFRV